MQNIESTDNRCVSNQPVVSESSGYVNNNDDGDVEKGNSISTTSNVEKYCQYKPPRAKNGKKNESKAENRKRCRNAGLAYVSSTNKKVSEKKFENIDCGCKKKCIDKISEASRKRIFEVFWRMGSFSSQNVYICGLVAQSVPKKRRPRDYSRMKKCTSNHYRFQVGANSIQVCKEYFLKTLQISDGRLMRALKKIRMGEQPDSDNRGRHKPGIKISDEKMKKVRDHISSFIPQQSNLSKTNNSNRKCLPSHLNVHLMYNLYKEYCQSTNTSPVREPIYRRTFKNDFNLHFYVSSKDTCIKCGAPKVKSSTLNNKHEKSYQQETHQKDVSSLFMNSKPSVIERPPPHGACESQENHYQQSETLQTPVQKKDTSNFLPYIPPVHHEFF